VNGKRPQVGFRFVEEAMWPLPYLSEIHAADARARTASESFTVLDYLLRYNIYKCRKKMAVGWVEELSPTQIG
jgi:hypothetical protein